LQKAEGIINQWIAKEQEKKRLTEEEGEQIESRFSYQKDISSLKDAEFVVEVPSCVTEAIIENAEAKKSVF